MKKRVIFVPKCIIMINLQYKFGSGGHWQQNNNNNNNEEMHWIPNKHWIGKVRERIQKIFESE